MKTNLNNGLKNKLWNSRNYAKMRTKIVNVNWQSLCFEMMCDYFPTSFETRKDKQMFLKLSVHFCALENRIENHLSVESKVFFNRTIGLGYTRNEMHETALPYYQKAFDYLPIYNDEAVPYEDIVKIYLCIAECHFQLDEYEKSLKYLEWLIKYLTNKTDCKNIHYFCTLLYRAKIYRFYGEEYYSLSKNDYESALKLESIIVENYYNDYYSSIVAAHVGLATTIFKMGDIEESNKHLHYACEMIKNGKQDDCSEEYASIFYDMGFLFDYFDEIDTALHYFSRALELEENMFYDDAHTIKLTLNKLSDIYSKKGNRKKADSYKKRSSLYTKRRVSH